MVFMYFDMNNGIDNQSGMEAVLIRGFNMDRKYKISG